MNSPSPSRRALLAAAALGTAAAVATPAEAFAKGKPDPKPKPGPKPKPTPKPTPVGPPVPEPLRVPEAIGSGGAVSSVDPYASAIGLQVLKDGGNAVDAAIATAAALGLTEPYSSGIGGGGFFVYREAKTGRTWTINGRETAPRTFHEGSLTDGNGNALNFNEVVTSGLSVGTPGTLATWAVAARRFGTRKLADLLEPAEELARRGFYVDANFRSQTSSNATRLARFPASAQLFLPGGAPPEVGSVFKNPDLADTYALIRRRGVNEFYHGQLAREIAAEAANPTTNPGDSVFKGQLRPQDLDRYTASVLKPTESSFTAAGHRQRLTVHGMGVPSSGGIAVGQILNLITAFAERTGIGLSQVSEIDYLHRFAEASSIAFADRNRWVGDVRGVPVNELLSMGFARERAGVFDPTRAQARPIPFGFPDGDYTTPPPLGTAQGEPYEGPHTTHFNVVDKWGNTVAYTLTIEQTAGSAITVPGRGFLLNNELTDFNFVPLTPGVPDPNLPGSGKQPRSSMSPTILSDKSGAVLAAGTPGGATIITTVAQIILGHLERGLPLVAAVAAPRISSRNSASAGVDGGLHTSATGAGLRALGHVLTNSGSIGLASGIDINGKTMIAAAETTRGGGGAARVVKPGR
ncbi:gamma-glutamyltransferase family protein [Aestuariimicrobium sp. Y1814]|uniref:gamma-glutamyltransferase family protein n=1 Tax=Aestuariimicrobium sp. Y1814 TaxID=3418742 RepID=UPI003DA6CEE0